MSEHLPARDDEWRQRLVELDAQAIMQGMGRHANAREQGAERGSLDGAADRH